MEQGLTIILFAYRETPHTTTGFSPFELTLGRTPKGPLDVLKRQWVGPSEQTGEDIVSYLTSTYDRMEKAAAVATKKEEKAKEVMTTYYNKKARLTSFQVGDLVLLLKPSSKMERALHCGAEVVHHHLQGEER